MAAHGSALLPRIKILSLCLTTSLCLAACGAPGTEPTGAPPVTEYFKAQSREWRTTVVEGREVRYEVADGEVVTEGDITWGPVDEFEAALASGRSSFGKFKNGDRWSMPIKYSFDNDMPAHAKDAVRAAMWKLTQESGANIRFDTCSTCLSSHIKFVYNGNGCSSPIGRQLFINKINLDTWCDDTGDLGSIMHEIMHSLGVYHEQQRCDRNSSVSVLYGNIEDGEGHNFDTDCNNSTDHLAYDYGSVMHYSPWAFSKNGLKTITAHDPSKDPLMGNRSALSFGDGAALRAMYGSTGGGGGGGGGGCMISPITQAPDSDNLYPVPEEPCFQ